MSEIQAIINPDNGTARVIAFKLDKEWIDSLRREI